MNYNECNDVHLLAEIADLYYRRDMSQEEIAKKFFFSRSKVSRILKRAKQLKIVEVSINYPFERHIELESELMQLFRLKNVMIIKDNLIDFGVSNKEMKENRLARFAAEFLDHLFMPGMIVGVSSGRTISRIAEEITPKRKMHINFTQVKGMSSQEHHYPYDSPPILRMFAKKYDTDYSQIYSPLFVDNDIARTWLMKEPLIDKVLRDSRNCDVLIASVSDFSTNNEGIWSGYLNEETQKEMVKSGTVGSMLSHFFRIDGSIGDANIDRKVIGLSIPEIQKLKNTVVVAGGRRKAKALIGAMNCHLIKTLICDEEIASEVIRIHKND